eukprot:SAG31_NODE_8894_length_1367_cov_1.435331_1_plen_211_part_01
MTGTTAEPPMERPILDAVARHLQHRLAGSHCQPCPRPAAGADPASLGPPMSVFVLIGQSNMSGRGALTPADRGDVAADVFCFEYEDDCWRPASQPLHRDPPIVASLPGPEVKGTGLGWAFARKLLDEGLVDGTVGLVPCAFGGSPLSRWTRKPRSRQGASSGDTPEDNYEGRALALPKNPGQPGDLYERAWRRTRLALTSHPNAVLRGFLW